MTDPVTLQFDELAGMLAGPDWRVRMPRREAQIFAVLLAAKGRAISADHLISVLYDLDEEPSNAEGAVQTHISKLRKKLTPVELQIKSFRFQGYALDLNGQNIASVTFGPLPMHDDISARPIYLTLANAVVISELRSLAQHYGCAPHHVASAIIEAVIAGNLIDAVFDGDAPQNFNAFQADGGICNIRPIGHRQQAVLDWFRKQPNGPVSIGAGAIGREIGAADAVVWYSLRSLCSRGHLRRVEKGYAGKGPSVYELVRAAP